MEVMYGWRDVDIVKVSEDFTAFAIAMSRSSRPYTGLRLAIKCLKSTRTQTEVTALSPPSYNLLEILWTFLSSCFDFKLENC